jgi:peptidyl-prolyl cis-trans isomerase C
MLLKTSATLAAAALSLSGVLAFAQTPPATPSAPPAAPAVNPKTIVAKVNGQPIYEAAVQRGLEQVPPNKRDEARAEILSFLIENTLLEQYLQQIKVVVDPKELDKMMDKAKADIKQMGKDWDIWLQNRQMTEEELKQVFITDLRWNTYATERATEKVLREQFEANRDMFDGTQVRARHILLMAPAGDAKAREAAKAELLSYKSEIEAKVAQGLAALPANTPPLEREKRRLDLLEKEFSEVAIQKSACASKTLGGDVNYFPRVGSMVEPFANAAFALSPSQISDVVQTPFGCHLILVTDRTAPKEVKFEDVKNDVREVYCAKLRDAMVAQARAVSKIETVKP